MPKISPELLSVLRCPVTGSPLVQDGEELVTTAACEDVGLTEHEEVIAFHLEQAHLAAESRLCHLERDGGSREAALLRDDGERRQAAPVFSIHS